MSIPDELNQLNELHQRGALSDDEFSLAKARVLGDAARGSAAPTAAAINALRRSRNDRWLGGVCGGLAQMSGLAAWLWRLMFVLLVSCAGIGALVYLLLWILLPQEDLPVGGQAHQAHAGQ